MPAIVPAIGLDIRNRRRAASADPAGTEVRLVERMRFVADGPEGDGADPASPRNRRASSRASPMPFRLRTAVIRSSRSPWSSVAESVLCAVEHKTEYVALRVMLRRPLLGLLALSDAGNAAT